MATSKTLAPTNVTISIPAMTDQPDASVFSNCVDKEADAINALNSQLGNTPTKIAQSVTANSTYELDILDNHSYLITHMTSSDESTRAILISRRSTYVRLFELAKGSWQSYYTETIADYKWTFANGGYQTMINIIDF